VFTALYSGILVLLFASIADAQTKPAQPAVRKEREFNVGGLFLGPTGLGETQADLLDGAGNSSVILARTRNSIAFGYGVEASLGYQLKRATWFEVVGGWTRLSLKSDIREDIENAQGDVVSSPVNRFVLGGAALFYFHQKPKSSWFLRTDGAWMRETAGGNTLTGDGFIGGAGLGMKWWWKTGRKSAFKRIGFRFEGRALVRYGGLTLGESSFRIGPAGTAHLVFGY
jgi:hypothetical protein